MMVVTVVPVEEVTAKGLGILNAAEALWKLWLIFQCFEVAFREWIVVRGVGPAGGAALYLSFCRSQ
jgi:hypothetical protein